MSEIIHRRDPEIIHIHPEHRPANATERIDLINKVGQVLHLNSNSLGILQYLAGIQQGDHSSYSQIEAIADHPTQNFHELKQQGLIYHAQYHYIRIDWKHIMVFAKYLNESNTAHDRYKVEAQPVEEERERSIIAELKANQYAIGDDTESGFEVIEDMTEKELCTLLERFKML